jgi:diguanylate cyclase (GGDEF)-like protein
MVARVLGAVLVISCAAVVVLGWSAYRSSVEAGTFSDRTMRLAELKGVVQLDSQLTMTARMSAATGEARWRKEYEVHKRELDRMLEELTGLAKSDGARRAVARIHRANESILKIEARSFELGRSEEARALIESAEYWAHEKEYHEGVEELMKVLEGEAKAQAEGGRRAVGLLLAGSSVALLVAIGAVLALVTSMRRHLVERESAVATLQALLDDRAELRERATVDALTGVWNRGTILEILESELKRARIGKGTLAVILGDLDHFKQVNDTKGHPAGDAVLRECAERMKSCVRPSDAVGRYGGEEFLVVLPGADAEAAAGTAERIRAAMAASTAGGIAMTMSLGVAAGRSDGDALVKAADGALYRAKAAGRNRVEVLRSS